ncbi:UDP-N-acetylglucosamine transferase subunit ALG14-like [Littorina saxatilis]|uniref:UDP-N-acetylglucosamine transferase subunit ALG14 n=1 Tax=Littorina saxatilis TaxID=31220 RepID=A0AAN9BBI2_9CAEN
MAVFYLLLVLSAVLISSLLLTYAVIARLRQKRETPGTKSILIVAGSGGHTKEILTLTEKLGGQCSSRHYVVAASDSISIKKIHSSERILSARNISGSKSEYGIYTVPRSREVKQSWMTTLFTTLYATLYSLRLVFQIKPEIILCNGPGTCVPLCYAGLLLKMFGIADTKIVYVESICRVETLSLSAKLLYPFADSLLVQWPDLVEKYPKCRYIGRVV